MRLRTILLALVAVAMLFAPLAMTGGQAMAAAPMAHQSMSAEHCQDGKAGKHHGSDQDRSDCATMCLALAVSADQQMAAPLKLRAPTQPSGDQPQRSFVAKLPTPPPRHA